MAPGIPTTHCQDYFYLEDNLIFMDDLPCNEVDIPEQQLDDNCDAEDDEQYYSGHNNHQLCESPQYTYCPNTSGMPPLLSHLKFGPNETRGQMFGFAYRGCHNEELHTRVHCTHEGVHDEEGAAAQCDETHRGDSGEQDMLSDDTHYIHRCPFKHCSSHHHHIKTKQNNKHKYNKTLLRISTSIKDEQSTPYSTLVNANKNCTMVDGMEASQLLRINSGISRPTFPMNSDETTPPPPAAAAAALNLLDNYQSSIVTRSISCRTGHRPLLQEEKHENLYEKPGSERLATEGHSHHQQHIMVKGFAHTTQEGSPGTTADQVKEICRSMGNEGGDVSGTDTRQRCDSPLYGDTTPVMVSAAQTGATKRCPIKDGKFFPSSPDEHQVTPTFRKRAIEYIVEQFGGGTSHTNNSDINVSTTTSSSPSNSKAVSRLYRTVERLEQTVYCAAAHRSKENYMRMLASKLATVYEELQHNHQWQQHAPSRPPAAGAGPQQQQQGCSRTLLVPQPPPSRQHLGAVLRPHESESDGSTDSTMEVCSTSVEQKSCDT